jgi:hypothetical protein
MGLSIWDGLPRTLHFEIDNWENKSWGLHAIDRRTTQCETAISANGSRMNTCNFEEFHHYLVPYARGSEHTLYVQPIHSGYSIDDVARMARGGECACSWDTEQIKSDDSRCSQTASERLPGSTNFGSGRIAGAVVVRYHNVDKDGTVHQLALAPELRCEVMEEILRWKGTVGIPGAQWRYRVTSYQPGEPDPRVFELPAGYSIQTARQ